MAKRPMTQAAQALLEQALSLPPEERIALADSLYVSTTASLDSEIEAAWVKEVESRIDAHESGATKSVPVEDILKRLDT